MFPYVALSFLAAMAIAHASLTIGRPNFRVHPLVTLAPLILASTLIAGLRYQTGGDWQIYEEWFNSFSFDSIFTFGVEPGWIAYSLILRKLGLDFDLYLLVTALLSNVLIWKGLHQVLGNRRVAIICFGFYCLIVFYSAQMFYIRAGLAAGLFLCAIAASRQSKLRAGAILVAAILAHSAAALATLIYLCIRLGARNRFWLLTSVFGLAIIFSFISALFLPKVYIEGDFADARSLNFKAFLGLVLFATIIFRLDHFKEQYSAEAAAISIAALTTPYMFDSFEVGGRVRMFFSPMDGLPIYFLVSLLVGRRHAAVPLLIASGMFVFIYWTNPYVLELFTPYRTWLAHFF